MSFFTTLHFYRPTQPPLITGRRLATFIQSFERLGVAKIDDKHLAQVKFGDKIDADDKPATWFEHLGSGVSVSNEIKWDIYRQCGSLTEVADSVDQDDVLYRAQIDLGVAVDEVRSAVQRIDSPENKINLTLDSWSLEIGPIHCSSLTSDESYYVGWMSINLSGYGYLFPWTFRDLTTRAEQSSAIARVMELCRQSWPVSSEKPSWRQRRGRKRMADLWPYPSTHIPFDWFWGLAETG